MVWHSLHVEPRLSEVHELTFDQLPQLTLHSVKLPDAFGDVPVQVCPLLTLLQLGLVYWH